MKAKHLAAAFLVCAPLLVPAGPVAAQESGGFFQNIFSAVGLTPRERDPIDYRERAPLALPPKMNLPPPQPPGAARGAAWPTDPDIVARREAARRNRKPVDSLDYGPGTGNIRLTPDQLRADRAAAGPPGLPTGSNGGWSDRGQAGVIASPDELRKVTSRADEPDLKPGELPRRRQLTDPPGSLRRATEFVAPKSEPVTRDDEADPKKFIREEALRR